MANISTGGIIRNIGFLNKLKIFFYFFFFGIMLIQAVILVVQAGGDFSPGVEYLGNKFFLSTQDLDNVSNKVIEQGGIYDSNRGFTGKSLQTFSTLFDMFSSIYIVYLWIKLFYFVFKKSFLSDESRWFTNVFLALMLYFGLEIIFILYFTEESIMFPIYAFGHFFQALPYIVQPMANFADKFTGTENNVTNMSNMS